MPRKISILPSSENWPRTNPEVVGTVTVDCFENPDCGMHIAAECHGYKRAQGTTSARTQTRSPGGPRMRIAVHDNPPPASHSVSAPCAEDEDFGERKIFQNVTILSVSCRVCANWC